MSFVLTNLHTMIVRAHDQRQIAIGKVIRITLQAVANGTLAVGNHKGTALNLTQSDRDCLDRLAAEAEAQNEFRWWTKPPWSQLRRMFVNEAQFWSWYDREPGASRPKAGTEKLLTPVPVVTVVLSSSKSSRSPLRQARAVKAGRAMRASRPTLDTKKPIAKHRDQLKQARARPEVDRADRALKVLCPDGKIPDQASAPNKVLLNKVNDCLRAMTPPLDPVKMDSLLRAASRRK
jgi:hypothetical protein